MKQLPQNLIEAIAKASTIVIIGKSATGKTTVTDQIREHFGDKFVYLHTDDYAENGYEQSLYDLIDALPSDPMPIVIEGVQGYRLLRKWAESGRYPDLIIETLCTPGERINRYVNRGEGYKVHALDKFDQNLNKVFQDFMAIARDRMPPVIKVRTDEESATRTVNPNDPRQVDYKV